MSRTPAVTSRSEQIRCWRDQLRLTRPRQWPILSVQLAVGVLCAPAVRSAITADADLSFVSLGAAWFAWVVGLNGGTLAFNSAYDRDVEDVAYLSAPPEPPPETARNALLLMTVGTVLGLAAGTLFAMITAVCVLLSVLYSHPRTRLKGVPGADLAVNALGYGVGTTLAGLVAGAHAAGASTAPDPGGWWLSCGFGLLFGSFYPMTQLYQIEADRERGDRTLASALGVRSSLALASALGLGAAFCLSRAFTSWGESLAAPAASGIAWVVFCSIWWVKSGGMSPGDHQRWMYRGLGVWALVDVVLLIGALSRPLGLSA